MVQKKLQVFVSSTYEDLLEERQAAVEAILEAGHIPAGMELFAPSDKSQMNTIKRWINESDVYMLILGGRYGSIEPKSKKSYIELEYNYAIEKDKPVFAVVIEPKYLEKKVRKYGSFVIEKDHPDKLRSFQARVLTRMVRFWSDPREIKLAILTAMAEFSNQPNLIGWVSGNELVRLEKENALLREKLLNLPPTKYTGLTFAQMTELLNKTILFTNEISVFGKNTINAIVKIFGDSEPSILHAFWILSQRLQGSRGIMENPEILRILQKLTASGLVQVQKLSGTSYFSLAGTGREYLLHLKIEKNIGEAEKYILS